MDESKWPGWAYHPDADRTGVMRESPTGRVFASADEVPPGWVDGDGKVVNKRRRPAEDASSE